MQQNKIKGASHVVMKESLAASSVTHVVTAIIQLNEANGGVNTTTEYLACHSLPISKRTLQINTRILKIGIQERLLQCKRHHTDKRAAETLNMVLPCLHSLLYIPHISNKCLKNCWQSPSNTPLQAITGEKTSIIITYRLISSLAEIV
jgi:hypothetical protein